MTYDPILHVLDDAELVQRMVSRRDAMRAGIKAAITIGTVPAALAAMSSTAFAQSGLPAAVVDVLNFALKLEYLESEFYNIATGATALPSQYNGPVNVLTAAAPQAVFAEIAKHEAAHVNVLRTALGTAAVAKPTFDFTGGSGATNASGKYTGPFADVFTNAQTFLAVAQAFEDTGVRAYKGGAAALAASPDTLEVALQIHSIEARHASKVRRLRAEKGWISGKTNTLPTQAQAVYGAGNSAANFPAEDNVTQATVNVSTLSGVAGAAAASEAFDEPLDSATVLAIAGLFIKP